MLRKSCGIVDLGFCYQRQSGLLYLFVHLTPCSGKYIMMNQCNVLLPQLYLNMDAEGTFKTLVTINQITWCHVTGDRNIWHKIQLEKKCRS